MHIFGNCASFTISYIISTFSVFEGLTVIFRCSFIYCGHARERAITEHIVDSSLDESDFVIHSCDLELRVTLLLLCFLCRALIFHIFLP